MTKMESNKLPTEEAVIPVDPSTIISEEEELFVISVHHDLQLFEALFEEWMAGPNYNYADAKSLLNHALEELLQSCTEEERAQILNSHHEADNMDGDQASGAEMLR